MVTNGTLTEMKFAGSGPTSTIMGATLLADEVGFTATIAVPDLVASCVEVAVIVTFVAEDTRGAVKRPEDDMWPAFVLHVTVEVKFPVPMTVAEHWLVCPDWTVEGEHDAVTNVIVDAGFTATVAVPDLVASCVEVAVTVTFVAEDTLGAVKRPEDDICPAFELHVIVEMKFPVPVTVAEHWLV